MAWGAASVKAQSPLGPDRTASEVFRDVVTEEELQKRAGASGTLKSQLQKAVEHAPVKNRPSSESSLYRKSIILFDGQMHTVVPVGSLLRLPPAYRNRVIQKPQGPFTFWPAFLKRNESWLGTWEVPLKMAQGDEALAKRVLLQTAKESRALVAVYRGGPISILQPVKSGNVTTGEANNTTGDN